MSVLPRGLTSSVFKKNADLGQEVAELARREVRTFIHEGSRGLWLVFEPPIGEGLDDRGRVRFVGLVERRDLEHRCHKKATAPVDDHKKLALHRTFAAQEFPLPERLESSGW